MDFFCWEGYGAMKARGWLAVGCVILGLTAGVAAAQNNQGPPIIVPKTKKSVAKPVTKPAAVKATLLVLCDLDCNWKLDGEDKGRIEAGKSAKAPVELGQHILAATTVDGLDKVQQRSEVKGTGQTAVSLELQPVLDARLLKAKQASDEQKRQRRAPRPSEYRTGSISVAGVRTLQGHSSDVMSVAFSPDGRRLASGDVQAEELWDVSNGDFIRTQDGGLSYSVAFSPDGSTLAAGTIHKICLWDVHSGQLLHTLEGHSDTVYSVAFSPDGRTLASAGDKTIKLWDVASGQLLRTLLGHKDWVHSVAFSPDGRTVASASDDQTIKLWDVANGQELSTLHGHENLVFSVAFSPDGHTLASGSTDQTVRLWNVSDGQLLRTIQVQGDDNWVNSVAFSPDGQTLASGCKDKTIKLWDVASGELLRTLQGHSAAVNSVAFSSDGRTLASGSDDKTIKLWDLSGGSQ
jgi:WD40 repeat protein